jgi:hypothetical protein
MDSVVTMSNDAVVAGDLANQAGSDAMSDANQGENASDMEELDRLKQSIEAHRAVANAQLIEA